MGKVIKRSFIHYTFPLIIKKHKIDSLIGRKCIIIDVSGKIIPIEYYRKLNKRVYIPIKER